MIYPTYAPLIFFASSCSSSSTAFWRSISAASYMCWQIFTRALQNLAFSIVQCTQQQQEKTKGGEKITRKKQSAKMNNKKNERKQKKRRRQKTTPPRHDNSKSKRGYMYTQQQQNTWNTNKRKISASTRDAFLLVSLVSTPQIVTRYLVCYLLPVFTSTGAIRLLGLWASRQRVGVAFEAELHLRQVWARVGSTCHGHVSPIYLQMAENSGLGVYNPPVTISLKKTHTHTHERKCKKTEKWSRQILKKKKKHSQKNTHTHPTF